MHRKAVFALAGVFLAIAFLVPMTLLLLQAQNDLIIIQNPTGIYTGNVSSGVPTVEQIAQSHQNTLFIAVAVGAVFVVLFAVTVWYGINHVHPTIDNSTLVR